MPLIPCTECSREVSALAAACPGCGCPQSAFPVLERDSASKVEPGRAVLVDSLSETRNDGSSTSAADQGDQLQEGSAPKDVGQSGLEVTGPEVTGLLVLLCGVIGLFYFSVLYDTSVGLEDVRIVNSGRVSDRNAGLVVSGVAAVVGTLLMMSGKSPLWGRLSRAVKVKTTTRASEPMSKFEVVYYVFLYVLAGSILFFVLVSLL